MTMLSESEMEKGFVHQTRMYQGVGHSKMIEIVNAQFNKEAPSIDEMLKYLQGLNPGDYSVKYEVNFQFWGEGSNHVFILKDGIKFHEDVQLERPQDAISSAYYFFKRILPKS